MLNSINLLNFTNKFNYNKNQSNSIQNHSINFKGLQFPNLSPLYNDTVSFTANRNGFTQELFQNTDNDIICEELSESARPLTKEIGKTLKTAFKDQICTSKEPHKAIRAIHVRTKSAVSIKEKTIDIYGDIKRNGKIDDFDPCNIEHIKKKLGDIVGARIVLANPENKEIKKIIGTLSQLTKEGKIHITSLKNYIPEGTSQDARRYPRQEWLMQLIDAQMQADPKSEVTIKNGINDSGYMGIHIGIVFENKENETPIRGEIQILDEYVAQLKDVEDFCYKIRGNKSIKGGDEAYLGFTQYFKSFYDNNPKYPNLKQDYLTYTKRAYEKQRQRGISTYEKPDGVLPTIKQCGMTGKIPEELDFNKLASIKLACDILYEQNHTEEE